MYPRKHNHNLLRDLGVIFLSILIAIILAKTGVLSDLLLKANGSLLITAFIAGVFFVSVFTAAPATVVLIEIVQGHSPFLVALIASLGALAGDFLIFRFIEDSFAKDLSDYINHSKLKRISLIFKVTPIRWFLAGIGAMIVASPLPDDFGLVLMGIAKLRASIFIPLFLVLNFIGILTIGLVMK